MESEEQLSQSMDTQPQADAFLAGMDPAEQSADLPGEDRVDSAPEEAPPGEGAPPVPEPQPEAPGPNYAADTPQAHTQRLQGVAEFARAFPEAYEQARRDPDSIPDSVWLGVNQGLSLTAAYARHAVDQARDEAQATRQSRENARRSTGSMRSAGGDGVWDAFLSGFDL